jgi:hypothetical protein
VILDGTASTGCGKMNQVGKPSIFSNQDSTTYRGIFGSKSPEITTLVHFSAACSSRALPKTDSGNQLALLTSLESPISPVPQGRLKIARRFSAGASAS